jgi:hypothetical protein
MVNCILCNKKGIKEKYPYRSEAIKFIDKLAGEELK